MTEIPKEALEKAAELVNAARGNFDSCWIPEHINGYYFGQVFARFIADVSETARHVLEQSGEHIEPGTKKELQSLILPNPEDDLLKEAREICAAVREKTDFSDARNYFEGIYDDTYPMRCTLAALKKGRG